MEEKENPPFFLQTKRREERKGRKNGNCKGGEFKEAIPFFGREEIKKGRKKEGGGDGRHILAKRGSPSLKGGKGKGVR